MSPYDRIDVLVVGKERLTARPIDFEYDKGEAVRATKYETTCPGCGGMVHFQIDDVYVDEDGVAHVGCSSCDSPAEIVETAPTLQKPEITVRQSGQKVEKTQPKQPVGQQCPFIDPIKLGIFDIAKVS